MATLITIPTRAQVAAAAILTGGCDGYRAGTTGQVQGRRQGCVVFTPDVPEDVARWARPRSSLLVPPAFVVTVAEA